ncbi:DNA endonuclease [Cyanophage PP]|uniref:DNA endonuclease n=1 Tax=Cyanophage PP TaxID=434346 RepID=U5PVP4_9CAUD|nr:HNH endonuclease [Cyanophage PP]AGY46503.1 DNA endonuclease [Cyanophage PP]
MSPEYVAGLFDGEGCVRLHKSKPKKGNGNYTVRVTLHNTYKPVLEDLHKTYGGFLHHDRTAVKPGCLPVYRWEATGHVAISFLQNVVDYLVIKHDQAVGALQWNNFRLTCPKQKDKSFINEYYILSDAVYNRLASMKRVSY